MVHSPVAGWSFFNKFYNLTHNQKINILKDRLLEIIIKSVLNEY